MPAIPPYEARSGIKSAERALRVFEVFYERRCPLKVTEIARALEMPQSSTSLLLKALADQGYLIYHAETRRYFPSVRLSMISGWIADTRFPDSGVYRQMLELSERFGQTVALCVRKDLCYETLSVVPARTDLRYEMKPRELRPLSRTTIGHLLLSAHDDGYVGRLLRRTNSLETDRGRQVVVEEALASIRHWRATGLARSESHAVEGVSVLAVLLPQPRVEENLALALVGPIEQLRRVADDAAAALLAARDRLCPAAATQSRM
ncbi:IclR family transcriptional regulator [Azospirillum sp. ST 5-10]|uniref:IclR family transcriptional regulator n=1 Tax=unclassified Azospirillum TaxID=2630922 RepID=UPI003F4A6467